MGLATVGFLVIVFLLVAAAASFHSSSTARKGSALLHVLHEHVMARSFDANDAQTPLNAWVKVKQAQAALEAVIEVEGGEALLSSATKEDVGQFREVLRLQEQALLAAAKNQ